MLKISSLLNCSFSLALPLKRILVATNLFGRGMDIERVNIVFNYDMPEDSDTYLHRVARAGRFGTKVSVDFPSYVIANLTENRRFTDEDFILISGSRHNSGQRRERRKDIE